MRLRAPTNWDDALLPQLAELGVAVVYGKASDDGMGGGRAASLLPRVSMRAAREHIALAHRHGLRFDYLINASCLANRELTRKGHREIVGLLHRLQDLGVAGVTVSTPAMVGIVREHAPHLRVTVGVFALVDTPRKAQRWAALGAHQLTLHEHVLNRDFEALAAVRAATDVELQVIANNACLHHCAWGHSHAAHLSHASQAGFADGAFLDPCYLGCRRLLLQQPVEAIKAVWIRPEDVHHYEALGIDCLKLVDRILPTADIVRIARAYAERRYDGDLSDIVPGLRGMAMPKRIGGPSTLQKLAALAQYDPRQLRPLRSIEDTALRIDNRALDGFIDHFVAGPSCRLVDCEACGYCARWADKAMKVDEKAREQLEGAIGELTEALVEGSIHRGGRRRG